MLIGTRYRNRFALETATVGVLAFAWVVAILLGLSGPEVTQTLSNIGLAVAALGAGVACGLAARRRSDGGRAMWLFLGASAIAWGVGQVIWTWYESILGKDVPFPSLADVGYLSAIPLAALSIVTMLHLGHGMAGRVRAVLDGLMIAGSMLAVSWILVLGPLMDAGSGSDLLAHIIGLAYPIGDVVIVTLVLFVLGRSRQLAQTMPLHLGLVGMGLVAIAIADTGFAYLTLIDAYSSGSVIDIGWFLGFVLILVAARKPATNAGTGRSAEEHVRPLGLLMPYVAVLGAVATSVGEQLMNGRVPQPVSWMRTFLLTAMMLRQALTLLENIALTRHLEARVVTRTEELQASERRFKALVQQSSDVITVVDVRGRINYQSESIKRVFGYSAEALTDTYLTDLLSPENSASLLRALEQLAHDPGGSSVLQLTIPHADGHECHAETTITNLLQDVNVAGLVLNTRDISERKILEDQLVHQAFHDPLTALANRALFKDRVHHSLLRREVQRETIAVLFLDLDGFKQVNDSLGHASGDLLLAQVGERLRSCVRPGDTVARLGGDEFAVLLDNVGNKDETRVAERILDALRRPFTLENRKIHVQASLGLATTDDGSVDLDQFMRNADLAMYKAKSMGGGIYERYNPAMHSALVERMEIEADLRRAVEQGHLVLHYQPTIALDSERIVGVEALVRWQHPTRGLMMPSEFVPIAEESSLIARVGRWVIHEACRQGAMWHKSFSHVGPFVISVNVSALQLRTSDIVKEVADALREHDFDPECLVLEMTESILVHNEEECAEILQELKTLGVRLAIDDFGTGYSSLSYLHRFPVDVLKIDRSFVERLAGSNKDKQLVGTIVKLGQSLGMETVAEGIEDYKQFLALRRMGCEMGQGYYLARPDEARVIERLFEAMPSMQLAE